MANPVLTIVLVLNSIGRDFSFSFFICSSGYFKGM
jgi:hypothetical protein